MRTARSLPYRGVSVQGVPVRETLPLCEQNDTQVWKHYHAPNGGINLEVACLLDADLKYSAPLEDPDHDVIAR